MIGITFGQLTVIKPIGHTKDRSIIFLCQCNCGNQREVVSYRLRKNRIYSCKNCALERTKKAATKHGLLKHPLYKRWHTIKQRCYSKSHPFYHLYGGKNITMCKEWKNSPTTFIEWALNQNWRPDLTIDRIDNNKGYSPGNCRWATYQEQQNNKTNNHRYRFQGENLTLREIWQKYQPHNLSFEGFKGRIWKGIPLEDALLPKTEFSERPRSEKGHFI